MRWTVLAIAVVLAGCVASEYRPMGYCSPTEVMNREPCPDTRDVPRLGYQPG